MSEDLNNEMIDEIPDEEPQRHNSSIKSGVRFARFIVLLVMAISALVLIFVNRDKINGDNFKRLFAKIDRGTMNIETADNSVIDFEYDSSGIIDIYKDGLARVTSDNLVIMDSIGTQFQSVLTGFNTPAMITNGKYVLVYDRGGSKLCVTNSFTVLFEANFDDNIVSVSMNENGYFAVITESNAYKNKIVVYDSQFNEVYKVNSLSRYVICADVSEDNKYIALSTLNVKDSNITPQICCYKLNAEDTFWVHDFQDDVAVDVICKNDGTFAALFEWGICILDSKGNEKYRYEFQNKILQNYCIDDGKYNYIVMSDSISGDSEIIVFNNNGKEVSKILLNDNVYSLDVHGDRVAVITRSELKIYSLSGKEIASRKNPNDGTKVIFCDKNLLLSVSASSAVYNLFK